MADERTAKLDAQAEELIVKIDTLGRPPTDKAPDCAKLAELEVKGRVLLVSEDATEALYLSARNIPYIHVVDVLALNPVSLVGSDFVVMTVDAVKKVEEWLA